MNLLHTYQAWVEDALKRTVDSLQGVPVRLKDAMGYSLLAGGKRLRPVLMLASAAAVGGEADLQERALPFAIAIEMIHTYSLIHDDLPAMDNDTLRRGKPTNHVVYGEAMAILAGDGLLSWAMETMTGEAVKWADKQSIHAMDAITRGCGIRGMVAGQVLDMESEGTPPDEATLTAIHRNKTGALIRAACEAGAWMGGGSNQQVEALATYGSELGLAFQLMDDLLDVTSTPKKLGKTPGKDEAGQKMTWVSLKGMAATRVDAEDAIARAMDTLSGFDFRADPLRTLAKDSLHRDH